MGLKKVNAVHDPFGLDAHNNNIQNVNFMKVILKIVSSTMLTKKGTKWHVVLQIKSLKTLGTKYN